MDNDERNREAHGRPANAGYVAVERAEEIFSDLLISVLQGTEEYFRDEDGFIRWGLVQEAFGARIRNEAVGPCRIV